MRADRPARRDGSARQGRPSGASAAGSAARSAAVLILYMARFGSRSHLSLAPDLRVFPEAQLTIDQRVLPAQSLARQVPLGGWLLYVTETVLVGGGTPSGQHRSTNPANQRRISRITAGGAGGARTHDRQIMRKPARPVLVLAETLHCQSVQVSRDPAG
jgi:hypothetical protein